MAGTEIEQAVMAFATRVPAYPHGRVRGGDAAADDVEVRMIVAPVSH